MEVTYGRRASLLHRARRGPASLDEAAVINVTPGVISVRFLRLRSVAAFAFVFCSGAAIVASTAAILAWHLAVRWGVVDDVEDLMIDVGFESFELVPGSLLQGLLITAASAVVVGTLLAVVTAILFNLVNWLTGGIELTIRQRTAAPVPSAEPDARAEAV